MKYCLAPLKETAVVTLLVMTMIFTRCGSPGNGSVDTAAKSADTTAATGKSEEWQSLIHGKTGWHAYGKDSFPNAWKVEDNTLHLDASQKNGWQTREGGDIVTDNDYK